MSPDIERRVAVELRASNRKLIGYAATFGTEARIADFVEIIEPGAFADSLRSQGDILALVDHNPSSLLARSKNGTLRLAEDEKGLRFEIDVPDTQLGRDVLALAERGDLGGMSFGFKVPEGGDRWQAQRRTLNRVDLKEISVVMAWPAYDNTTVAARSAKPALTRAHRFLETICGF